LFLPSSLAVALSLAFPVCTFAGPEGVELIEPGTVVEEGPPKGWSHLIIKSAPRLRPADDGRVSSTTRYLSTFLTTAFVAHVEPVRAPNGPARHQLCKVALGVCTKINDQDVVVSPDTQRPLGANLGVLARTVLSKVYEKQQEARVAACTATMAVVDTPVIMLRGARHQHCVTRYALLVDPATGRLESLVWLIDRDRRGQYVGVPASAAEWLPPSKLETPLMRVDDNEFTLGVASEKAVAITGLPRGQARFDFPAAARPAAAKYSPGGEDADLLERALRNMLRSPAPRK
jgi:hypothetical protein